jgi:DNA-binding winged helix-turn-helix (wHTH) protein
MSPMQQWYFGPFRLDADSGCLWRDDDLIPLSPKPVALLACLVARAGEVVTKETLLATVWPETAVTEGVLKTYIGQIRQVLGETARAPRYIETISRRGYRFISSITVTVHGEVPMVQAQMVPGEQVATMAPDRVASLPLVGRAVELAQLRTYWDRACGGERQVVAITGEAGIGKTSLVDTFIAQLALPTDVQVGRGQCIEQYGAGEPYLPLLEAVGRLGRGIQGAALGRCCGSRRQAG